LTLFSVLSPSVGTKGLLDRFTRSDLEEIAADFGLRRNSRETKPALAARILPVWEQRWDAKNRVLEWLAGFVDGGLSRAERETLRRLSLRQLAMVRNIMVRWRG